MSGETWEPPTKKALREALLPLSEQMPGAGGLLADPAADGPVIVAWGVDQLAEALACEMRKLHVGSQHTCPDEPWNTLRVMEQFLNSGAALMKSRAHYEGAKWCVSKVQQLRDGEITVQQMQDGTS